MIDLDALETEKPLTAEEEQKLQKLKHLFRYSIESGGEANTITITPMGENGAIILRGKAEIQQFIKNVLDLARNA